MNIEKLDLQGIKQSIIQFMESELYIDMAAVNDQTSLLSSGLIDSRSILSLVAHVESLCDMRFNPFDINLDNLDSIDKIVDFVSKKNAT